MLTQLGAGTGTLPSEYAGLSLMESLGVDNNLLNGAPHCGDTSLQMIMLRDDGAQPVAVCLCRHTSGSVSEFEQPA